MADQKYSIAPIGEVFELLTVTGYSHRSGKRNYWMCRCECGTERAFRAFRLITGVTKSCGCRISALTRKRMTTHGHAGAKLSRTYTAWASMRTRCLNLNHKTSLWHGRRGITICQRWINSFENFLADMGECPIGLTLERIDNNGNYEPDNCKWATMLEQNNNRRGLTWITWQSETLNVAQWARRFNVNRSTMSMRIFTKGPIGALEFSVLKLQESTSAPPVE